jgi:hypothetical protein
MSAVGSSIAAGNVPSQVEAVPKSPSTADSLPLLHASDQGFGAGQPIPWWLWWNLLSIDAPLVALVWATLFARGGGGKLAGTEAVVLALAVWVIYVGDRLLDCKLSKNPAALHERHRFCKRHRLALLGLLAMACAILIWLTANRLPAVEVNAGLRLGAVLLMYMAAIHGAPGWLAGIVPKEMAVGLLFAAGAILPIWSQSIRFPLGSLLPWGFFAALCALNCLSIECWESCRNNSQEVPPRFLRWVSARIDLIAVGLAGGAVFGCFAASCGESRIPGLLAVGAGSLLLLLLNRSRDRLSPAALRVLADAALLVPALIALGVGER